MVDGSIRRAASMALVLTLLFGLLAPLGGYGAVHAAGDRLTDIADSYAQREIQALVDAGIVSGYEDGTIRPRQPMTRAELAKIVALALGLKAEPEAAESFADVGPGSWYAGYVGALVQAGITQGQAENAFAPQAYVTREELVVIFIRAFGLEGLAKKLKPVAGFSDFEQVADWAKPHVSLAYRIGFVQGVEAGDGSIRFQPKDFAERQALARLAYEFYTGKAAYAEKANRLAEPVQKEVPDKPQEPKQPAAPTAPAGGGFGGGGSSSGGGGSTVTFNAPGTYTGDYTIRSSGTYGPTSGSATVNGKLTVDPGPDGEVTLRNLTATSIEVRSGASGSIKLDRVIVNGSLGVNASGQSNSVRIQLLDGTVVTRTEVGSKVILDAAKGMTGNVDIQPSAADQTVELRGTFAGEIKVASGANGVKLALAEGATVEKIIVQSQATIETNNNVQLKSLTLERPANIELKGNGQVQNVTVAQSAAGATIKLNSGTTVTKIKLEGDTKIEGDPGLAGKIVIEAGEGVKIDADAELKAALKSAAIADAVEAINALGTIAEYSEAKEAEVRSARGKVNASKALGAGDADIPNLDALLAAEAKIAELKPLRIDVQSVAGATVTVALNKTITSVHAEAHEVTVGSAVYKVGIWHETTADRMLPIVRLEGPGTSGRELILTFDLPPEDGQYMVRLYTGTIGQHDFRVAAVSGSFAVSAGNPGGGDPGDPGDPASIGLEYLGHAAFILTTEQKKILMDAWFPAAFNLPRYALANESAINLATVSHLHDDHVAVSEVAPTAFQAQQVIQGVDIASGTVNTISNAVYGDVAISTVNLPHFERNSPFRDFEPNAGFVFEAAGMRIAHMGDAFGPIIDGLTEEEKTALKGASGIDVLMLPVGDAFGQAHDSGKLLAVIQALSPKAVIPIHAWSHKQQFLDAAAAAGYPVQDKAANMTFGKADLPAGGTVVWNMVTSVVPVPDVTVAAQTDTTATLSFTVPAGATPVSIEQSVDNGLTWAAAATVEPLTALSTSTTVTGLSPNTMYLFRIGMMTGTGHGISLSAPAAATTNPPSGGGGPTTGNPVPKITGYTVIPGFEPGSVMIVGYTPENPDHTLKYKKQSEPFAVPNAGEAVPADAWNLGGDIVSVQAGDHIGLYEVDMNGIIVKFADILLTADHIPVAAPVIGDYTVEPGSTAGSTKITYTPEPGTSLKLVVSQLGNFSPTFPLVGGSFYDPAVDYTSGSDITGVAAGQHLRLYEVNGDGKVVRYLQLQLTAAHINGG